MAVVCVAAVAALGACKQDDRLLPPGQFSGSTSLDQRVHLVLGDDPKVNGRKASWDGRGRIKLDGVPGEPVMECRVQAEGEELSCVLPTPGAPSGYETVELMRE